MLDKGIVHFHKGRNRMEQDFITVLRTAQYIEHFWNFPLNMFGVKQNCGWGGGRGLPYV